MGSFLELNHWLSQEVNQQKCDFFENSRHYQYSDPRNISLEDQTCSPSNPLSTDTLISAVHVDLLWWHGVSWYLQIHSIKVCISSKGGWVWNYLSKEELTDTINFQVAARCLFLIVSQLGPQVTWWVCFQVCSMPFHQEHVKKPRVRLMVHQKKKTHLWEEISSCWESQMIDRVSLQGTCDDSHGKQTLRPFISYGNRLRGFRMQQIN